MTDEDRELLKALIASVQRLASAIEKETMLRASGASGAGGRPANFRTTIAYDPNKVYGPYRLSGNCGGGQPG